MTDTVLQSFCERCGTGFMLELPPEKPAPSPSVLGRFKRKAPEPNAGAEAAGVYPPAEALEGASHFCLECRRYNCNDCWNEQEGHCITCRPPGARATAAAARGASAAPDAAPAPRVAEPKPTLWPSDDMARAASAGTPAVTPKTTDQPAAPVPPASSASPASPSSPLPADSRATSKANAASASSGDALPWTSEPGSDPWRGVVFSADEKSPSDRTVESAAPAGTVEDRPSSWPGIDDVPAPEPQAAVLAPTSGDGGATEGSDAAGDEVLSPLASLGETEAHVDAADWARASAAVVGHGILKSNAAVTESAAATAADSAAISQAAPLTEVVAEDPAEAVAGPAEVVAGPIEEPAAPAEETASVPAEVGAGPIEEPAAPAEETASVPVSTGVRADDGAMTELEAEVAAAVDAEVGAQAEPSTATAADIDDITETTADPDVAIEPLPDHWIAAGLVVAAAQATPEPLKGSIAAESIEPMAESTEPMAESTEPQPLPPVELEAEPVEPQSLPPVELEAESPVPASVPRQPSAPAEPGPPVRPIAPIAPPPGLQVWSTPAEPGPFAQPYQAAPAGMSPMVASMPAVVSSAPAIMAPAPPPAPRPALAPLPPMAMPPPPTPPPPTSVARIPAAATRACPSCALPLSTKARFCRRCGTPQPA